MVHGNHEYIGIVKERYQHLLNNRPAGPLESKVLFKFRHKPSCFLHWLQNAAARMKTCGGSREVVEEARTVPKPEFQSCDCH